MSGTNGHRRTWVNRNREWLLMFGSVARRSPGARREVVTREDVVLRRMLVRYRNPHLHDDLVALGYSMDLVIRWSLAGRRALGNERV